MSMAFNRKGQRGGCPVAGLPTTSVILSVRKLRPMLYESDGGLIVLGDVVRSPAGAVASARRPTCSQLHPCYRPCPFCVLCFQCSFPPPTFNFDLFIRASLTPPPAPARPRPLVLPYPLLPMIIVPAAITQLRFASLLCAPLCNPLTSQPNLGHILCKHPPLACSSAS